MKSYQEVLESCYSLIKPCLMTEFGFGAIPGVNSFDFTRWSEDYQTDASDFTLDQLLNNDSPSDESPPKKEHTVLSEVFMAGILE